MLQTTTSYASRFRASAAELKRLPVLISCSLLIALHLVLSNFSLILSPTLHIGFAFLANACVGLLFGPVPAMLTGAIGDLLGCLLHPTGPFFPPFTLTAMCGGLLYGSFLYQQPVQLWRAVAAKSAVSLFCNVFLNTLWNSLLYGKGFLILLPARLLKNILLLPIECLLLWIVAKTLQKAYFLSQQAIHARHLSQ